VSQRKLFEEGLTFFESARFFEAHEVWEDLWRVSEGLPKLFYQGMIQVAVGLHHQDRNNPVGARGQLRKAIRNLSKVPSGMHDVNTDDLILQLQRIVDQDRPETVRIVRLK